MFHSQIGWNVEVYVDDMLVKSLDEGKHLHDLQETFDTQVYKCFVGYEGQGMEFKSSTESFIHIYT